MQLFLYQLHHTLIFVIVLYQKIDLEYPLTYNVLIVALSIMETAIRYQKLSEEQVDGLEKFIKEHSPIVLRDSISNRDLVDGKKIYADMISNQTGPTYAIFGLCGYTSFSLYKSRDQKVYMFRVFMQTLDAYNIVENDGAFTVR